MIWNEDIPSDDAEGLLSKWQKLDTWLTLPHIPSETQHKMKGDMERFNITESSFFNLSNLSRMSTNQSSDAWGKTAGAQRKTVVASVLSLVFWSLTIDPEFLWPQGNKFLSYNVGPSL